MTSRDSVFSSSVLGALSTNIHILLENDKTSCPVLAALAKTGQGRAGQDRTGQDRTGQDRTGQDRTGQDRTGQDRTGQDRTGQDVAKSKHEAPEMYMPILECLSRMDDERKIIIT